jgi:hypothetical protein
MFALIFPIANSSPNFALPINKSDPSESLPAKIPEHEEEKSSEACRHSAKVQLNLI